MSNQITIRRWIIILSLVFAGEMIFSLPFHLPRFYRATFLPVFEINNTALGDAIAVYGVMAILAYFPGGILADRFSARKLMAFSLLATGLGGFYLYTIPGVIGLSVLYGFWGITTIFLFWAGMIKATREWGGSLAQGKAFGILEGGRGLVAAGVASIGVIILGFYLSDNLGTIDNADRKVGFQSVILMYSLLTMAAAVLVWITIPDKKGIIDSARQNPIEDALKVLKSRKVWMQALIVVSAYVGYKAVDFYTLYGTDVLHMDEITAAWFVSGTAYIRVLAAIAAGLIADRYSGTGVVAALFGLLAVSYFALSFVSPDHGLLYLVYANLVISITAIYALRGVYFTLLEETQIKHNLTGTSVGLISVVGFTPDAFFNSLAGRIVDAKPGLEGFKDFYLMLALFSLAGLIASSILIFQKNKRFIETHKTG